MPGLWLFHSLQNGGRLKRRTSDRQPQSLSYQDPAQSPSQEALSRSEKGLTMRLGIMVIVP